MPRVESRSRVSADELFEVIAEEFQGDAGVQRATIFGLPGLKVHGRFFAVLSDGGLVVKLPHHRVDALVLSGRGEPFAGHGRVMKGWVTLGLHQREEWPAFTVEAHDFVAASA